jgi:hypothetical protein
MNWKGEAEKMKKKNNILKLFRYASIAMSLLSCFTTYQGFRNTVFASEKTGITAMIASLAIQTVLLAAVLKYFPMRDSFKKKCEEEIQEREAEENQEKIEKEIKKAEERNTAKEIKTIKIRYQLQISIMKIIIGFALSVSVLFSYISIVNNMYIDDFAVNANITLEKFMKNSVQQMEKDNDAYLTALREKVVAQLKKNGQKIIDQSVAKNAKDYAIATAQITPIRGRTCLIDLNENNGGIEKDSGEAIRLGSQKVKIQRIKDAYAEAEYKMLMEKNPKLKKTKFAHGLKTKINHLNENIYITYCNYYNQYYDAVKRYNIWHKNMRKGNPPSLEKMKSLKSSCTSMEKEINKLLETIHAVQDGHAKKNTKRLIAEASDNVRPLLDAVKSLETSVNKMINNSYGKNSKSFSEIIQAFGSTATDRKELKAARDQMLKMQGILLENVSSSASAEKTGSKKDKENLSVSEENTKNEEDKTAAENAGAEMEEVTGLETEETDSAEVTELMDNLEKYVTAVQYNKKLQGLKKKIEKNYNIDNSIKKKSTKGKIITVNSEQWTRIKKLQMTSFTAFLYQHPVNLYGFSEEEENENKDEDGERYEKMITKAYTYRKNYLDTSESEKAFHLLLGGKEYFPYKGKAVLSILFAAFLDVGAFGIGYFMYRMEDKNSLKKE